MKKYLVIFLLPFCLFGCEVAKDIKEMSAKQANVQTVIKEKFGWDSQVGWQIHNGVLTHVTVVFKASDVKDQQVVALETVVQEAVSQSFNARPQALYIQIESTPSRGT